VTKFRRCWRSFVGFAIVLGFPIGLYVLLTRAGAAPCAKSGKGARARVAVQAAALARQSHRVWHRGHDAQRVDLDHEVGRHARYDKGWTAVLGLRVPVLGGEVDVDVLPREPATLPRPRVWR